MNSVRGLRNHLEIVQQVFSNALTEESPLSSQPPHIQLPLRAHQLASLYSMKEKEIQLRRGWTIPGTQQTLFSQYAFLGDRVGVGKTLTVLGHISQMATHPLTESTLPSLSNLHPSSTASCFSISPSEESPHLYDSLIVVPHTIYKQWQESIETQTTLKAHFLKSQRDLDKDSLITNLQNCHCTLISNTLLPSLFTTLRARQIESPTWRRVFFDEADSIKITSTCPHPLARMTWYVTSSFTNLLFENSYYHSYVIRQLPTSFLESLDPELRDSLQSSIDNHPNVQFFRTKSQGFLNNIKNDHPLRGYLVVKSSSRFLDSSIELPPLFQRIIRCLTPPSQKILGQAIPSETEQMLNAGDIQGALQSLSVPNHTPFTIIEAVTGFHQRELERLQRLLEFKKEEIYGTQQAKENAISILEGKIGRLEQQIEGIRSRIEEATKESCSICFDTPSDAVLTPCCSKLFCGSCILSWMIRTPICPLCRGSFHPSDLKCISEHYTIQKPSIVLPKKMDALLQIFQENPNGRFLVFSRYENPLQTIHQTISENWPTTTLHGNKDSIANILNDYEKGKYKILLLNSRYVAAGMNIPSATHVILLHRMGLEEEKQILGRAYRLGRKTSLEFIKLLYEKE